MQNDSTKSKWMWIGVNAIVILYAFIPVLWIVSLSLKDAGSLNDGNFWPRSITWALVADSHPSVSAAPTGASTGWSTDLARRTAA